MEQRTIVDATCKTGIENLATEIGALLGQELTCAEVNFQLISKDTLFGDSERVKTALTRMSVSGDKEGEAYLLTQINSAIVLGGTLIMLPEDMIEEHVQNSELDGELNDAFGEVANIIAGVFTQAFVDKYPANLRIVKNSVEELDPATIDLASNEPFPAGKYYVASCKLAAGEKNLGKLELVFPAVIFDLDEAAEEAPEAADEPPAAAAEPPATAETDPATAEVKAADTAESATTEAPEAPPLEAAAPKPTFADAKKLTDVIFSTTVSQIGEQVGALLGQKLTCDDIQLLMTSKADFFTSHCTDKSVMARLQVSGDKEDCGYLFSRVQDAIALGGTLIMLPAEQIEEQRANIQFEGEVADAFGEVANILTGSLSQVFLDRYPKQLRIVRTESTTITPSTIDPASDDPFPEGDFYLASFAIHMEGYELHRFMLLFPAELFELDNIPSAAAEQSSPVTEAAAAGATDAATTAAAATAEPGEAASTAAVAAPSGPPLVLVISDETGAAQNVAEILSSADYDCKVLNFQEDIKPLLTQNQVLGAFLIMSQVNEKGFATAIKLQSGDRPLPPVIFAGPEWTRSTVLRAIKYGAHDILIMPASGEEIQEKISQHFRKAS